MKIYLSSLVLCTVALHTPTNPSASSQAHQNGQQNRSHILTNRRGAIVPKPEGAITPNETNTPRNQTSLLKTPNSNV